MELQTKDIVSYTIASFAEEVANATLDGWEISDVNPGDIGGFGQMYTVSMYRNADTLENARTKMSAIEERPKRTRAEQLADARAVRAANRARLDTDSIQ